MRRTLLRPGALLAVAALALGGHLATKSPAIAATTTVTLSAASVPEAPDYAGEALSDSWDYANSEDLTTIPNVGNAGVRNARYTADGYAFSADRGGYLDLVSTTPGAIPTGRDGALAPIDAGRYSRLSVRLWSSVATTAQVFWFSCPDALAGCQGATQLAVRPGWGVYDLEMTNTTGTPAPWAGQLESLRLVPGGTAGGDFELDWLRVYQPAPTAKVTVTREGSGVAELWLDTDLVPGNGTESLLGPITSTATLSSSMLPPGRHHVVVRDDGGWHYAERPLDVDATPQPVVLDPDLAGGTDYAEAVRGDAWDFDQAADVTGLENVVGGSVTGGAVQGTNGGVNPNDPQVRLPLGPAIDGTRFHRLTFDLEVGGPFSLEDAPGGGMLARMIWQVAGGGPEDYQDLDDVVVHPGRRTYTVDLATDPSWAIVDPTTPRRIGWAGQQVTSLRFDPNEDPGPRDWRLHDIRIAADDAGAGTFVVRFRDNAWEPGTVADIAVDSDAVGYDGRVVARDVAVASGVNTYHWELGDVPPGRYWVHVTLRDPRGSVGRTYATGPVAMTAGSTSPRPELEIGTTRYAGADRYQSSADISRNTFDPGVPVAYVATGTGFADALAGSPAAAVAGGPVLLVAPGDVPDSVAGELRRLRPGRIVVLGGASVVSDAVATDLAAYTDGAVTRIGGVDRYDTAARVAAAAFPRADAAYVASGATFPDALAGAVAAARDRRPLLLVTRDSVPASTRAAIEAMGVTRTTVLGSSAVVGDSVAASVNATQRLGGENRYATAVEISRTFPSASTVYVAAGTNFPDALSGVSSAHAAGAPLLLSTGPCVTAGTVAEIERLGADRAVVLGGPAAVSATGTGLPVC